MTLPCAPCEADNDLDNNQAAKLTASTTEATSRYERLRDGLAAADRIARRMRRLTSNDRPDWTAAVTHTVTSLGHPGETRLSAGARRSQEAVVVW